MNDKFRVEKFRSLSDLSLTANNLDCLPEEIGDLSQLTVLRVDDNRLSSLPDSIGRLSRLEELQVKKKEDCGLISKVHILIFDYFFSGGTESID